MCIVCQVDDMIYVMAIMAWVYGMGSVHNSKPERSRVTI